MRDVFITRVSGFLPNDPVSNEDMETVLGLIGGQRSRARGIVLRNNGIRQRHYALDRAGNITHTNAQLAAQAVRALEGDGLALSELEVLACGTSSPDQFLPSHAAQVHGELGHAPLEIMSMAGACCSGMHALKSAYLHVASGMARNAVATGIELTGPMMRAGNFEQETERYRELEQDPIIGFEKEFLRWMLSDGAAAVLLEAAPRGPLSLRLEWIESRSFANELDVCMYSGGDKDAEGRFQGWKNYVPQDLASRSIFTMKQDVKLLSRNIVPIGVRYLREVFERRKLDPARVDHMLVHYSSMFFRDKLHDEMVGQGIGIPLDKWFVNLPQVGNVGSASIFLQLRDLLAGGLVKKGQHVLLMVPESARFSYAFALLTAV
ncbi:MAG TPA: beta-ketoacyl-ACP synthase III [Flavobacteriales bacterium]|nr:beta-ketoacyl-ACP synthase III [Flavobacteriales bacterium]